MDLNPLIFNPSYSQVGWATAPSLPNISVPDHRHPSICPMPLARPAVRMSAGAMQRDAPDLQGSIRAKALYLPYELHINDRVKN